MTARRYTDADVQSVRDALETAPPYYLTDGDDLARIVLDAIDDRLIPGDDIRYLLGTISDALRNGSYMTNANVAFEALCSILGADRDSLPLDRERTREVYRRQFNLAAIVGESP